MTPCIPQSCQKSARLIPYIASLSYTSSKASIYPARPVRSNVQVWLMSWIYLPVEMKLLHWAERPVPAFRPFGVQLLWVYSPAIRTRDRLICNIIKSEIHYTTNNMLKVLFKLRVKTNNKNGQILTMWETMNKYTFYLQLLDADSISHNGRMNESHCLSSPWPGFNSRPWRSISRDFCLACHNLSTRPEPARQKIVQSPLDGTTQPVEVEKEG